MEAPKREIITAVIFGLIAGAVFSFTVWMIKNKTISPPTQKQKTNKKTPEPTPIPKKKPSFITIASPSTNPYITTEKKFDLKGEALPESTVIISTEDEDFIITADKKGNFSKKVTVEKSINQFFLTAIDSENNYKSQSITVYYEKQQ